MKSLFIKLVLINTLILSLIEFSIASENTRLRDTQNLKMSTIIYPQISLQELKDMGKFIAGEDFLRIDDIAYSKKRVESLLLMSLFSNCSEISVDDEVYERGFLIEKVLETYRNDSNLFNAKIIDQYDLKTYINLRYPELRFDTEKTYEVAQILLFCNLLNGLTLEASVKDLRIKNNL